MYVRMFFTYEKNGFFSHMKGMFFACFSMECL